MIQQKMIFLAPTSFSKKLKFFNRWIPTGPLYIRSTPKWPRILCCSAACFFSLVKFEAETNEHWKYPINQWINQINLSTYQYLAIYLWLSMHISKPIFQSTLSLSQSTKLAMSGLLTKKTSRRWLASCSLSNFLLPWLVFQQQQLILTAVETWDKQPNNEMRVLGSGGSIFQVNSILCCQINLMP